MDINKFFYKYFAILYKTFLFYKKTFQILYKLKILSLS